MTLFSNLGPKKSKPKTPSELIAKALSALEHITTASGDKDFERASKECTEHLGLIKLNLLGPDGDRPDDDSVKTETVEALLGTDIVSLMVTQLARLDFETRKDVVAAFVSLCKFHAADDGCPGLDHLRARHHVVEALFKGYDHNHTAIALSCGTMLRYTFRDEGIVRAVLESDMLVQFFDRIQNPSFEIASDAFNSFEKLLKSHEALVAEFLQTHYEVFFEHYEDLLRSSNYVTRRQSTKLLAELLMGSHNVLIMVRYVSDVRNLMLVMNVLRDPARTIQFEAFHVFKVFVANPRKPDQVKSILMSNKEKLLRFLGTFLEDREDDEDFMAEKADIIKEIQDLQYDGPSGFGSEQGRLSMSQLPSFGSFGRPMKTDSNAASDGASDVMEHSGRGRAASADRESGLRTMSDVDDVRSGRHGTDTLDHSATKRSS